MNTHESNNTCTVNETPPSPPPIPVVPPVIPAQPPAPPQPSSAPSNPVSNTVNSGGGGGMVACSGPLSPGYHVDTGACTPVTAPTVPVQPVAEIKLSSIPYTGGLGLNYGQIFLVALLVAAIGTYLIFHFYSEKNSS